MTNTRRKNARDGILIVFISGVVVFTVYLLLTFKKCWSLDLSFESTPQVEWCYEGDVALVPTAIHGSQSVRLGQPVLPTPGFIMTSQVYQEMVIPEDQDRPVLSFWYRMCVNENIDLADFRAYLITSTVDISGTEPIPVEEIKRDGYRSCEATRPLACYDLKWRTASYDLTHLRGQTVTLVFETNNLYTESLGIWTHVDHVQVVDAGHLPTAGPPSAELHYIYLPMTMRHYSACDWLDPGSRCVCP
jgi:hypothetical protein